MSGNADLLIENGRLKSFLDIAMNTLEQIATTPRNKGARINANATLKFIQTQSQDKANEHKD